MEGGLIVSTKTRARRASHKTGVAAFARGSKPWHSVVPCGAPPATKPMPVFSPPISIAVAPGYSFTNDASGNATFDAQYTFLTSVAGVDTSNSGAPIVILAESMSLSGGTINASAFGQVLLAPATPTNNISLNPATPPANALTLMSADLNSITAGSLQLGYRNIDGTVTGAFTGNIDIAGNTQINTNLINDGFGDSTLLLVTGGAVTQSGGTLGATGPNALQLGILAGAATLDQKNNVGTLAAYVDGGNFSFVNDSSALTIGTLAFSGGQPGIAFVNGFPLPIGMVGPAPNPLAGITATNGTINVDVTTSGNLIIASGATVTAGGGNNVVLSTVGDFVNNEVATPCRRRAAGAG